MTVYNGTGFFVEADLLEKIPADALFDAFPVLKKDFLLPSDDCKKNASGPISLRDILTVNQLITPETMIQYDLPVVFAGEFHAVLDEAAVDPDSGDAEMIYSLKENEGYDYAVSNVTELSNKLETVTAILQHFSLISSYDIVETYWFIMPWPEK